MNEGKAAGEKSGKKEKPAIHSFESLSMMCRENATSHQYRAHLLLSQLKKSRVWLSNVILYQEFFS
jgi:hypothetical protein